MTVRFRYACLLLVVVVLASAHVQYHGARPLRTSAPKIENVPRTGTGLVQETQAHWKARPNVSGGFFVEGDIPGLEGSDPRKVVQKHPISPRGRLPLAPGPPPRDFGRISELRSLILSTVLGQASHRMI